MKTASIALCALLIALVTSATAQSYVEILATSRLTVMAGAFQDQNALKDEPFLPLVAGQKNEVALQAFGNEQGKCGEPSRLSASGSKASALFNAEPSRFDLILATDLRVQGGYAAQGLEQHLPLGPKLCIPRPPIETGATAEGETEAVIQIKFNQDVEPGNYWLDLTFASKNSSGDRKIQLIDPEGKLITPVSGEPVLLRGEPNASYYLKAAFQDKSFDIGRCCGKEQHATLQVSAAIRPASKLLEQSNASGNSDQDGSYGSVGLLLTLNAKGEPIPVCIATVVGKNSLITAAHCLTRFGNGKPTDDRPIWFIQNASVKAGLRRGVLDVVGWSVPSEYANLVTTLKSDTSLRVKQDIAVVFTAGDLGPQAVLNDNIKLDLLLANIEVKATLVNYGPTLETVANDRTAATWARSVVGVRIMNDTSKDELLVSTNDQQCGTESGSPVFVASGSIKILAGILVHGSSDCSLKTGPRIERHINWLRSQIR